jgi:hypothetical protein
VTVSLVTQRVIYNGTDISVAMGDYRNQHVVVSYNAGEYFYIGTSVPFNNIWMQLNPVANHTPGAPIIQVWWGKAWTSVVDIIDGTDEMQQAGRISWALDINKGWDIEQKSADVGLTGTSIYNRYWLRMSWAAHYNSQLDYIGQKFSSDAMLESMYPDLLQPAILEGFKTGKTTWDEQHFMAADAIVKEMRKRNFILGAGQLMDWTVFEEASCHKVAEIAYQAFGAPYREHATEARKRYNEELNSRCFVIDSNANGHIEPMETTDRQGWLTR